MHCQLRVVSSTVPASANHGCTGLACCRKPHIRFYSGHGTCSQNDDKGEGRMIILLGIWSLFVTIGRSISKKKKKDFWLRGRGRSMLVYYMYSTVQGCTYSTVQRHLCGCIVHILGGSNWNKHVIKAASRHTYARIYWTATIAALI